MKEPISIWPDISSLIAHLQSEHQEGDCYRGQTEMYRNMVPSLYRPFVEDFLSDDGLVLVDSDRYFRYATSTRIVAKRKIMNGLINKFGIALGNLLAQQYGLSSECIDITLDPVVAAFFATRAYPSYQHFTGDKCGVIYRFRKSEFESSSIVDKNLGLDSLFEMGRMENVLFDWFVSPDKLETVFDRDKWFGNVPPEERFVSTIPTIVTWTDVHRLSSEYVNEIGRHERITPRDNRRFDWRRSRLFGQKGGLIRPAFRWLAEVPSEFQLWQSGMERPLVRDEIPSFRLGSINTHRLALAVPSAAVKRRLIGLVDVHTEPYCEAFSFQHTSQRVIGPFRRDLWPEISEDPVFRYLWNKALPYLIASTSNLAESERYAVDDPDKGLLDRGYQVLGEGRSLDGRSLEDLIRGQKEDAVEAIEHAPTSKAFTRYAACLGERQAVRAMIQAVRLCPTDPDVVAALASSLYNIGKSLTALHVLVIASKNLPEHYRIRETIGVIGYYNGRLAESAKALDRAIELFDPAVHYGPEYSLVFYRAVVAGLLGDEIKFAEMSERYVSLGFEEEDVTSEIRRFKENEVALH
ncbi:MAG: FRG domain-containing protein [Fimbriimonas sp.]